MSNCGTKTIRRQVLQLQVNGYNIFVMCSAVSSLFVQKRSGDIAGLGDNCSEHLPDICAVYSGVSQSMLETIVPKTEDACIRVVRGQYKGQVS